MAKTRSSSSNGAGGDYSSLLPRIAIGIAVIALTLFAIEGGEYGSSDLFSRQKRKAALESDVERLQKTVDSLAQEIRLIGTDTRVLERIAREEYGMVRGDRELLYRFADELQDTERR